MAKSCKSLIKLQFTVRNISMARWLVGHGMSVGWSLGLLNLHAHFPPISSLSSAYNTTRTHRPSRFSVAKAAFRPFPRMSQSESIPWHYQLGSETSNHCHSPQSCHVFHYLSDLTTPMNSRTLIFIKRLLFYQWPMSTAFAAVFTLCSFIKPIGLVSWRKVDVGQAYVYFRSKFWRKPIATFSVWFSLRAQNLAEPGHACFLFLDFIAIDAHAVAARGESGGITLTSSPSGSQIHRQTFGVLASQVHERQTASLVKDLRRCMSPSYGNRLLTDFHHLPVTRLVTRPLFRTSWSSSFRYWHVTVDSRQRNGSLRRMNY